MVTQRASRDAKLLPPASYAAVYAMRDSSSTAQLASVLLPLANSPERRQVLAQHARITVKRHGTYEPIETCNSAPLGQLRL